MSSENKYAVILEAERYLHTLNDKYFKLSLSTTLVPNAKDTLTIGGYQCSAYYHPSWRYHKSEHRYGEIVFNCDYLIKQTREYVFETVRHELAHAICDLRYNNQEGDCNMGHGKIWIRVAKLLRVNTKRYEDLLNNEFINCLKHIPPPPNTKRI
jgi:hypothetical protein